MKKNCLSYFVLSLYLALCVGCGGSGGDNFFGGAAYVKIQASPDLIDVGDSTFVVVDVDDVNDPAFFLKIRFPAGLDYIRGSSYLRVGNEDFQRDPDVVFTSTSENNKYMVYFLTRAEMGEKKKTRISFDLVGIARVSKGDIEVDADIDDPNEVNSQEFSVNEPKFDQEASDEVRVR